MKFSSSFTVVMKTSSLQLPSLAGTLSIKSMLLESAPKHVIFILKIKKCSGEEAQPPLQTHPPAGGGHTLPHPPPLGACGSSIFAPSALTHAPPPTRKSGYGPAFRYKTGR